MSERLLNLDGYYFAAVAIDLVILMAILFLVRQIFSLATGMSSIKALTVNDNHAFGVSLAGATLALAIMLIGVASGDVAASLGAEALSVLGYGVGGIVLLILARWIFDSLAFPKLDIKNGIKENNLAVGILDAGNMIATALILRGAMTWVEGVWLETVLALLGAFVASQLLLTLASRYRVLVFSQRNSGRQFGDAVSAGNAALALRFAGFQAGAALAVSTAGSFVLFPIAGGSAVLYALLWWLLVAAILLLLAVIMTIVLERVVLAGVSVSQEVDREANIGVAAVEAAAYAGVGLLIAGLLS